MFYLTCPQEIPRHRRWWIGHAVSQDLVTWDDCGIILEPGPSGSWDGLCPATGSVVEFQGQYYMAYTGNFAGPEPTTGIAISDDLHGWRKLDSNPVTRIDGVLYSAAPNLAWKQPRWRDPFLYREGDSVYQLVTAAKPDAPAEVSGTVGLAVSSDMKSWKLLPPLDVPELAQDLECPKIAKVHGRYILSFSVSEKIMGPDLRSRQPAGLPLSTTFSMVSNSLTGPYQIHGSGRILESIHWGSPYACEPVFFKGQHYLLGTVWSDTTDDMVCDPISIEPTAEGFKARPAVQSTNQRAARKTG